MPTSLTDQMFETKTVDDEDLSMTDQMFGEKQQTSLTSQMFEPKSVKGNLKYSFEPSDISTPYLPSITTAEEKHGLPENLLARLIETESEFNPEALSKSGAIGIAQIVPKWHPDIDPTDPEASIDYAAELLKKHYDKFGDWDKAIAAYNAGPGRVSKGMDKLPLETRNYLEKINKFRVEQDKDVQTEVTKDIKPDEFKEVGKGTTKGKLMTELLTPSVQEFDILKANPILTEKFKSEVVETLQGYANLATQPMEVVKGGAELALSMPGFGLGIIGAAQKMLERMGRPFTLNDLYDAASEGMEDLQTYWGEKMVEPLLGKPSAISQLVGQTAMAPAIGLAKIGQGIAERFEGSPNIQGLAKFSGDIGGLVALGRIYKGSNAKVTAKAEQVVRKAEDIANRENLLNKTFDEAIKSAQAEVLRTEKIQLELEAKELQKNLDYEKMIKEDLGSKGRQVKQIKQGQRDILDVQVDKALKELPEKDRSKIKRTKKPDEVIEEPITDLDLQTNTVKEPIEFSTERSPFREHEKDTTNAMAKVYEERAKGVANDPELFTGKLINDVNRWLDGQKIPIEQVREGLSSLAARSEEIRNMFAEDPSYPMNFINWQEMVGEAAKWARKAEPLKIDPGTKLLDITQVPAEAAKAVVDGAKRLSAYTKRARGMKAFKPVQAARMLKEEFNRSFIDRSGNIRGSLLKDLGEDGYSIVQKMYLSKGASSLSANMLKQMGKEVYSGLSKKEKRILDNLILSDRMSDIGKYKTTKQFKFPEGLTPTDSAAYGELFQFIEKIDSNTAANLRQRAGAYFEWMKKPLGDLLECGLISEKEYTDLVAHNYRQIKLVDVFDKRYQVKIGKKKRTVYDSGIESLARGRETDVFEPSSEIMALEVFNRSYGRILNNKANQSLLELAKSDPKNQFVRIKEEKGDKIPSGWDRAFVYEDGQRKAMYLSPEMSKEWIINNPEMSYKASQMLRYASLSPVLRTFATGINWGFSLANLPRDIQHIWFTARAFEDGKWKPIYNPNMPVFAVQMGHDLASVFLDAVMRKGRYKEYIKDGGGMEFLVHQGRLFQRGRHVEGAIDKVYDFLGYFGETSEILTRLAIRERALRKGKSREEAAFIARDYMDFGQGGGIAKAADNAFPYLNAAIQGTRGLLRSFKPGSGSALSSTFKLSQYAALVSGLYIAMNKMHPESSKALKGNIDMQNNLVLPLGDDFGFEDSRGQIRYPYIKIPIDPGQKFFKTFFEAATDKWLGNEVDVNRVVDSLKEFSPVSVTELPPTISGVLGYVTNKDFWLNEDIWRKTDKPFDFPRSKEEFIPGKTPQAYIDFGANTGLSPERTKFAVEELVTNGTVWSYLLGQGYDAVFSDLPKSKKEQHMAEVLSKIPVVKRFFGITNPYSQFAETIDEAKEKSELDRWIQNRGLDMRVEGYLIDKTVTRKEVIDYIAGFKDKKIFDRLKDRFVFQQKIKSLPNRSFWLRMKSLNVEARAEVYAKRLKDAGEVERKQLMSELQKIIAIGGVVTKGFRGEVSKIEQVR